MALDEDQRVLLLTQDLPPTLVNNALDVQSANREYQERALARDGLRRMYIGTLTLSLFMAVLGAILLTGYLGGAVATHLRIGSPLVSHTLFGVYLGVAVWAALWCRLPTLRALIPLRSETP